MAYISNVQDVRPSFNLQVHTAMEFNLPIDRPIHIYVLGESNLIAPNVHVVSEYTTEVEPNSIIVWISGKIRFEKNNWNIYVPRILNGFLDIVELASHYESDNIRRPSVGYTNMLGFPIQDVPVYAVAMLSETASSISNLANLRDYVDEYRYGYLPGSIFLVGSSF